VIPLHLFVASLLGWLQREQYEIIQYLREETAYRRPSCAISACGSPTTNDDR
jgi:hypothetical protein